MKLNSLNNILEFQNLSGTYAKLEKDIEDKNILCIFQNKGARYHTAAALNRPTIYVAKDSYSAIVAYQRLQGFLDDNVVLYQPNDDLLFYRKTFQKSAVLDRVKSLYKFATKKAKVLVTSSTALIQYVPKIKRIIDSVITIQVGQKLDMYEFIDALSMLGYEREEVCEEKNTFAVHGDILDIFIADMSKPIRISFFDDEIENIKVYDLETLLSIETLDSITLFPNNDLLLKKSEIDRALKIANLECQKLLSNAVIRCEQIISDLSLLQNSDQKMQWLIPFLKTSLTSLTSYLPTNGVIVFDEPDAIYNAISNCLKENEVRVKELSLQGEVTKLHTLSFITMPELEENLLNIRKIAFSNLISSNILIKPESILKFNTRRINNYILKYDILYEDLRQFSKANCMTILCQPTKERAKALQNSLKDNDIICEFKDIIDKFMPGTYVVNENISEGFNLYDNRIVIIGSEDITRKGAQSLGRSSKTSVFVMPQVGDYVVHEIHGIGKCLGSIRMQVGSSEQDYVAIQYKNNGLLYLPINQMDKISRYSGSEKAPQLSSLGGKDFSKLKDSVKKSLKTVAINLVQLYSQRLNEKGYKYSEDDYLMKEFEDSFKFEPTPDQIDAIMDIKQDMEQGKVMDRLLCGDVGFGKTEVALRAIFKTILNGKQAAILVPTTILAQQHYRTAIDRLSPFGINVELASRLRTSKEIKQSISNMETGKSQLIIATHRLLSKDIKFHDLGLLVLDEEQRFGVEHKEKLKLLKKNLNVLTLSATPIPRTLNMALVGIRDISVLETPPINRISVQTSVTELTPALLEDTINRELSRGGQVFILYNDVATIDKMAAQVQTLVPKAKVVFAHGQMDSITLENRIDDFYEQRANVLVCTTIIENGIDVPDANTLIICDADKLGLSQLYQLRGRVGRSNRLAYAYFTVDPNKVLTDNALKRLNAIMDYTELGSGFKIAMRDLEIRGAGNILGREQHGHIEKVGYDMYCKLLQECVNEIQGIEKQTTQCKVDVEINAYLPKDYIEEENSRLKIFRDIIDIRTQSEEDKLLKQLQDSFGEVPDTLKNLIEIGFVKNLAESINVENIIIKNIGMNLTFANTGFMQNEKILKAIGRLANNVVMTNEEKPKLVFNTKNMGNIQKLKMIKMFLLDAVN